MKLLAREDITSEHHAMLGEYLAWLNAQSRLNGDPLDPPTTFSDYWWPLDFEADEDSPANNLEFLDPPRLMLDTALLSIDDGYPQPDERYAQDRIIIISCTPFHDEGGPATLTAWFSWDDGWRYSHTRSVEPRWILDTIVQEFDTYRNIIYTQGALVVEGSCPGPYIADPPEKEE